MINFLYKNTFTDWNNFSDLKILSPSFTVELQAHHIFRHVSEVWHLILHAPQMSSDAPSFYMYLQYLLYSSFPPTHNCRDTNYISYTPSPIDWRLGTRMERSASDEESHRTFKYLEKKNYLFEFDSYNHMRPTTGGVHIGGGCCSVDGSRLHEFLYLFVITDRNLLKIQTYYMGGSTQMSKKFSESAGSCCVLQCFNVLRTSL